VSEERRPETTVEPAAPSPAEASGHAAEVVDETNNAFTDTFLSSHGADGEAGGHADGTGGLELDARQAHEVQSVFLTALPQYLEPIEQMLDQLVAVGDPKGETRQALSATLSSLSAAASRVSLSEVYERLEAMSERALMFQSVAGPLPKETTQPLYDELKTIRAIAQGDTPDVAASSAAPQSQTIFAALRGVEGIDDSSLARLTSAGLVNVDQLRVASADEIVAVTGLDPRTVEGILAAVGQRPAAAPLPESEPAASTTPSNLIELPLGVEALREQIREQLRVQVDTEAALFEARAEVQRLGAPLSELRNELADAMRRKDRLQCELTRLDGEQATRAAALEKVKEDWHTWQQRTLTAAGALRTQQRELTDLRQEHEDSIRLQHQLQQELAGLMDRVQGVLGRARRL
jgi:hypothetical protein